TFAQRVRKTNAANGVFARQFTRYANQIQTQYTTQTFSNCISAIAILGALLVFGVDFAYLWAFLAFFLGYIPMIGLVIACVPAVFLAFYSVWPRNSAGGASADHSAQCGDGQFRDAALHGRPAEHANRLHHDRLPLLGLDLWAARGALGGA